jgi:hypothetical protein
MVSNRDIGFVYAGQDAEIKIDTPSASPAMGFFKEKLLVSLKTLLRVKSPQANPMKKHQAQSQPPVNQRARS